MRKYSENLKATFFIGISSFLTSGINYLTTPIFTRLITTAEYGLISRYNSYYLIISVIATLTLSRPGILNVGLHEHKESRWSYLSSMLGLITVSTLFISIIMYILWNPLSNVLQIPPSLIILMILTCFLQPATTFWTYKQRYEYNWKPVCIVTIGTAVLAQVFSVFAVLWFREQGNVNLGIVRLYSSSTINLFVALLIFIRICFLGKKFIDLNLWRTTLIFALPLIPHYLGFSFLNGMDKIMIGNMVGDDKVGIYSLSSVISTIGLLLWQALCVSITPFIFKRLQLREYNSIRLHVKPLLEIVAICCILISLLAPEIICIFGTKDYLEGIVVMPAVTAGTFMHVLYDLFSNVAFFKKKSIYIMLATLLAALINGILNFVCIKEFGYLSAGYTTLVSYAALTFFHYKISVYLGGEPLFTGTDVCLISVGVSFMCGLSILLLNNTFLKFIFVLILFLYMIKRRNNYLQAISEMKV